MSSIPRRARLIGAGIAATALLSTGTLLGAGTASAHVSAVGDNLTQGGYGVINFRVPNESDTANTVSVSVTLPNLKSARTEPIPGWTAEITKDAATEEATSVTWRTVEGNPGIKPGEFLQFPLSAGPLPEQETVEFPAVQTYSDGEIVNWDQPTVEGEPEPDKPAPAVTLATASADGHHADSSTESTAQVGAVEQADDNTARWLGGIGIALGALGIGIGIGAVLRSRR